MGMFKDLREITKMGNQMRKEHAPSMRDSISQAREMMEDVQGQLGEQSVAQDPNARPGTATIMAIRDTGITINENPKVEFDLQVTDAAGFTYVVTHAQLVSRLQVGALQTGATVNVKIDPADRNRLAIV